MVLREIGEIFRFPCAVGQVMHPEDGTVHKQEHCGSKVCPCHDVYTSAGQTLA
jgi:hypothetical protein